MVDLLDTPCIEKTAIAFYFVPEFTAQKVEKKCISLCKLLKLVVLHYAFKILSKERTDN